MFKIAAFISFGDNFNSRVLKLKKKVKNKYGNQIYLNHPVHLTLFTLKIKKISSKPKILKNLNRYNPKAIAFDIVFSEEDKQNPKDLLQQLQKIP